MVLQHLQNEIVWRVLDDLDTAGRMSVARVSRSMRGHVDAYARSGRWTSLTVHDPGDEKCAEFYNGIVGESCTHLNVRCTNSDDVEKLLRAAAPVAAARVRELVLEISGGRRSGHMTRVQNTLGGTICRFKALESLDVRLGVVEEISELTFSTQDGDEFRNLRRLSITEALPVQKNRTACRSTRVVAAYSASLDEPYSRSVRVALAGVADNLSRLTYVELAVKRSDVMELLLSTERLENLQTLEYITGDVPADDDVPEDVYLDVKISSLKRLELCFVDYDRLVSVLYNIEWLDVLVLHISDDGNDPWTTSIIDPLPATDVYMYLYSLTSQRKSINLVNADIYTEQPRGGTEPRRTERIHVAGVHTTKTWDVYLPCVEDSGQLRDALRVLRVDLTAVTLMAHHDTRFMYELEHGG